MAGRSVPSVTIDDITYLIVPNSAKHKMGKGEWKVSAASAGGGAVEMNVTEDAETKVSMVKFKVFTTPENEEGFRLWKQNAGKHTISLSQPGLKTLSGTHMTCTNDPEWEDSADGQAEIEWAGDPLT